MVEFWAFAVLFTAGLVALARHSGLAYRIDVGLRRRRRDRFERLWSRWDGRLLALVWLGVFSTAWLAPFAVDITLWGSVGEHPTRDAVLLGVQAIASVLLVPLTAGLYVFGHAIPQIGSNEADERERLVQGRVYRRTHLLIMAGSAILGTLLAAAPDAVRYLLIVAHTHDVGWVAVLLPVWVLLFMLPSLVYAWMDPRRDDDAEAEAAKP